MERKKKLLYLVFHYLMETFNQGCLVDRITIWLETNLEVLTVAMIQSEACHKQIHHGVVHI